jgi:hypothetical protein
MSKLRIQSKSDIVVHDDSHPAQADPAEPVLIVNGVPKARVSREIAAGYIDLSVRTLSNLEESGVLIPAREGRSVRQKELRMRMTNKRLNGRAAQSNTRATYSQLIAEGHMNIEWRDCGLCKVRHAGLPRVQGSRWHREDIRGLLGTCEQLAEGRVPYPLPTRSNGRPYPQWFLNTVARVELGASMLALEPSFEGCHEDWAPFIREMADVDLYGELGVRVGGWIYLDMSMPWQGLIAGQTFKCVSDLQHAVMHKRLRGKENVWYQAFDHYPMRDVWVEEMRLFAESGPYGRDSMASIITIP